MAINIVSKKDIDNQEKHLNILDIEIYEELKALGLNHLMKKVSDMKWLSYELAQNKLKNILDIS
jgi:hypothetical protein